MNDSGWGVMDILSKHILMIRGAGVRFKRVQFAGWRRGDSLFVSHSEFNGEHDCGTRLVYCMCLSTSHRIGSLQKKLIYEDFAIFSHVFPYVAREALS